MRRSILILNLVLLVLAGLEAHRLRAGWLNYQSRTNWIYQARPHETAESFALGQRGPAQANWAEIVARNIFHPDRNSVVATAASSPPPPEPILYGTLDLGNGPIALMSEAPSRGFRKVRVGDPIGGYRLVAVEGQTATLEWAGGRIKLDAAESASRLRAETGAEASLPSPAAVKTVQSGAKGVAVVSPSSPATSATSESVLTRFPELRGVATKQQLADLEREPPGTIRDGKQKRVSTSPFGVQVWWEDVKPGEVKK